jgi:hypothetical protein
MLWKIASGEKIELARHRTFNAFSQIPQNRDAVQKVISRQ